MGRPIDGLRRLGTPLGWLWDGFGTPYGTAQIVNVCRPWDGGTPYLPPQPREKKFSPPCVPLYNHGLVRSFELAERRRIACFHSCLFVSIRGCIELLRLRVCLLSCLCRRSCRPRLPAGPIWV